MTLVVQPTQVAPLTLDFLDESTGSPADPSSVQLDVTYGGEVGLVPDAAGPYFYTGAMSSTPGEVYRTGVGQYTFAWQVPPGSPGGVYVANWTCVYGGTTFLGTENFIVSGGMVPISVPSGDTGYWTGSLAYNGNTVNFGTVDGNGICWLWNKITGWDGPPVSGGIIQRSGDHGGWASPQFYAPRTPTLTVTASAPTQALRDYARALLSQVVPVGDLAVLTYNEPIPKMAQVRLSGNITETYPTLCDVQFVIGLAAPDPRKYSATVHSVTVAATPNSDTGVVFPVTFPITFPAQMPSGQTMVTNAGNFETRPVITITGPVTSPALTSLTTGQTVSWTGLMLMAGQTMTVDFNAKTATIAGSYQPADITSSWWVMEPGQTEIQLGGSAGAGASFTVVWSDSWIYAWSETWEGLSVATSIVNTPVVAMDGIATDASVLRTLLVTAFTYDIGSQSAALPLGGVLPGPGALEITAPGGMNVTASSGFCIVPAQLASNGAYSCGLMTSGNLTVATADPSNPRIDLVYFFVSDTGGSGSTAGVQYQAGTPAPSPVAPSLPAAAIALAEVNVGAGVTTITSGNISDQRDFTAPPGAVGQVSGLANLPQGYPGAYFYDQQTGRFVHNSGAGSLGYQQPVLLPFNPKVKVSNSGSDPGTANNITLLSANVTTDGNTDISIYIKWASIYANSGSGNGTADMRIYIDGTQVDSVLATFNNGGSGTPGQAGGSYTHYTSSQTSDTPSAGSHTITWQMYVSYAGSDFIYVHQGPTYPMIMRISAVPL